VNPDRPSGHIVVTQPVVQGDELLKIRLSWIFCGGHPRLAQIPFGDELQHLLIYAEFHQVSPPGFLLAFQHPLQLHKVRGRMFQQRIGRRFAP